MDDPPNQYKCDVLLAPRKNTVDRTIFERFIGLAHEIELMKTADEFYKRFAFEISRITPYVPGKHSDAVAKLFDLHRRHAEQVNSVIQEAMTLHVHDFYHGKLDATCGLMTAFALGAQKAPPQAQPTADGAEAVASAYTPTKNALLILRVLSTATMLMQQVDLVAATDETGTRLSERTIGPILQKLVEHKLVEFPEGPRSGVRITEEGRKLLAASDRISA